MKQFFILGNLFLAGLTACTPSPRQVSNENLISQMSLEEKAHFVIGTGMKGFSGKNAVIGTTQKLVPGAAGTTYPLDSLGIPAIVLADGPAGLRIDAKRNNDTASYYCTHFPIGTLLASTWNQSLVEEVGKAIGEEVKEYGADVLLAPALNIHRNPLCGRNFEYYSEDPLVSGKTAAAYVRGVQSNGVGTSLKHFTGNNQETNRMNTDARISQRALREIYLKGFEIAVKESNPWTIMTSYNYLNGIYTSENKELLQTILRDEWGFKGVVMTDWFGGVDGAKQIAAGNDMLQPGREEQYQSIITAVENGNLAEADLDTCVNRILGLIKKTPRFNKYNYTNRPNLQAHAVVTRQSATEGMVLLKNDNKTLPLTESIKTVSLYGCCSYNMIAGGTGSGNVNRAYVVSLLEGLSNAGYSINRELETLYHLHIDEENKRLKEMPTDNPLAHYLPSPLPVEKIFTPEKLAGDVKNSDVAIITIGRLSGEFADRTTDDFNLSVEEKELIAQVCTAYHAAGKKVIVLLNIGGVIETASWKHLPDAILCAWQAGQEGGNSIADVLSGKVSPSGKLTMTWPIEYTDHASSSNFPLNMKPDLNLTDHGVLKSDCKDYDFTNYVEDIYVGYRYFESFNKSVSYPFGYGLSYTSFEYSDCSVKANDDDFNIQVTVTNTGKIEGKEVVQLYVSDIFNKERNKPVKELKAFAKTKTLKPGESETLTMCVRLSDLASFDETCSSWVVDSGEYIFLVGASVEDIKDSLKVPVGSYKQRVNDVLKMNASFKRLQR